MGYCENNVILYTTMPSNIILNVYDEQFNLVEQRIITFTVSSGERLSGIYYFNQNGRHVPSRDLINSENV